LARALSKLGYCSRSQARQWILAGRVRLNDQIRFDPETPVHLEQDRIQVDGRASATASRIYWMLNKPRGVVTTAADEKGRKTVYELLPAPTPWITPVGRLDKASEGLLLLTNDSAWSARVLAPATHLDKIYHVQIDAVATPSLLQSLALGKRVDNGDFLRVKRVRILRGGRRNTWLEITLDQGKNRHLRRLLAACQVKVLRLVRVAIGPLALGELAKGAVRPLTREERKMVDRALSGGQEPPNPRVD
jgi:23S rRNA pseudouridine2605 synthase